MSKNIENRRAFFEGLGQTSATVSFLTVGEKKRVADVAPAKMPTDCGNSCISNDYHVPYASPTDCGASCVGSSLTVSSPNRRREIAATCMGVCNGACVNSCIRNTYYVPYASASASLASSTARIPAKTTA